MDVFRPFRTALCVYEGLRLAFLIGTFMLLQPEGEVNFPWLTLITPGALFMLMALFWRIDITRYHVYVPLYLAGKGLSVITTMFWIFFAESSNMRGLIFHSAALLIVPGIVFFLILGDILSVWLVNSFIRVKLSDNAQLSENSE